MEFRFLFDIYFTVFPDFGVKVSSLTEMSDNSLQFFAKVVWHSEGYSREVREVVDPNSEVITHGNLIYQSEVFAKVVWNSKVYSRKVREVFDPHSEVITYGNLIYLSTSV